ncbi:MAG: class I SAM-dependent methyltransferase [Treponema sp.]|nr:class I SAM-dependent methyltransferase [Treponema sp.]
MNDLKKVYLRDEAMRIAAGSGGGYIETGNLQKEILINYGLKPNMSIIDFGCGSGRLANALPADYNLDYLGIDVIEELLKFARSKSPKNYKFNMHKKLLSVPVKSESMDFICAFELFPFLLHEEIYIYLEDMKRALKKDGRVIFSFLEFDNHQHWHVFNNSVNDKKNKMPSCLNTFTEKPVLKLWAEKIGFKIIEFANTPYKQSLAIFEKP